MSDLISRAELFNKLSALNDKAEIFAAINDMPTVDAVPVKHGKWDALRVFPAYDVRMVCSVCGKYDAPLVRWNYCPTCGAVMDLEENNG